MSLNVSRPARGSAVAGHSAGGITLYTTGAVSGWMNEGGGQRSCDVPRVPDVRTDTCTGGVKVVTSCSTPLSEWLALTGHMLSGAGI